MCQDFVPYPCRTLPNIQKTGFSFFIKTLESIKNQKEITLNIITVRIRIHGTVTRIFFRVVFAFKAIKTATKTGKKLEER